MANYTQDKAHSSALLGAILNGEKAQEQEAQQLQQKQQQQTSSTKKPTSDSASIFSTSSFGSTKALLKKVVPGKSNKASGSGS